MVVDGQNMQVPELGRIERRLFFRRWRRAKPCREMKRTAVAHLALHPHAPVHHSHQACADSQTETGPAVPACSRVVSLRESLEYLFLFFGRNADARVGYRHMQTDFFVGLRI